jgi:hypothetical protein
MSIRGILLGSTAALLAASGARAADAVIAPEPEPVEYVRVCDVYGTSFYYIPGTEICLKIGGYFRYDIGYGDLFGEISDTGDETWDKRARFQLRVDARTETELGTLRGYFAYNFNWETGTSATTSTVVTDLNGDGIIQVGEIAEVTTTDFDARDTAGIEHGYVELAGFRIGVTDSLFSTETGYSSDVVKDGLISYGPFTTPSTPATASRSRRPSKRAPTTKPSARSSRTMRRILLPARPIAAACLACRWSAATTATKRSSRPRAASTSSRPMRSPSS